jgi:Uma2 family endonuclease
MNIAIRKPMTVAEYLAWAEAPSERQPTELINGQILAKYPHPVLTVAEYSDWAAAQCGRQRTELINGQIVAMTPERVEHVEVRVAAANALGAGIVREFRVTPSAME